jgi:hypothetical protein
MAVDIAPRVRPRCCRPSLRGGAVPTLALLVLALALVFALVLGERIVGVGALQSMAFQLPELGILSLAMMIALLSGGLNLSDHRDREPLRADDGLGADDAGAGHHGATWVGWQLLAILAGVGVGCDRRAGQRLRHRLPGCLADPRDAGDHDDVQGAGDRHDTRQRALRLSEDHPLSRQRRGRGGARRADRLPRAVRARRGAARQDAVRAPGPHDRLEREGDPLLRRRHAARAARRVPAVQPAGGWWRRWS